MIFLEVVNFSLKFLDLVKEFFGTVFEQSGLNFWEHFWTIRVEFLGLFLDSPNRVFRTIFGQSRTVLRFCFYPGSDVFGFIFHLRVVSVLVEP